MRRMPIRHRRSFPPIEMPQSGLRGISRDFSRLFPCGGQVAYVLLTRAPVAGGVQQADRPAAPRLACVKPVASVHPEPGSNSSLLISYFYFFLFIRPWRLSRQLALPLTSAFHYSRIAYPLGCPFIVRCMSLPV